MKCTGSGSGGDTKAGFDIGNADDAKQSDPHKPGPMLAVVGTRCDNRWSAEVKEKQWTRGSLDCQSVCGVNTDIRVSCGLRDIMERIGFVDTLQVRRIELCTRQVYISAFRILSL